jgi:hypothetical protein
VACQQYSSQCQTPPSTSRIPQDLRFSQLQHSPSDSSPLCEQSLFVLELPSEKAGDGDGGKENSSHWNTGFFSLDWLIQPGA